jgi:hypothetical protein
MIATEPHLSEAIEIGISQPAQLMADTLYTAQKRRHQDSGVLTGVSEGPLDREPWFAYQGYEIGPGGGAWRVYAPDSSPEWQTTAFVENARMVSTKAAFLWLAFRSDDYSRLLHDHVRNRTKSPTLGFSAGIYEKSGQVSNEFDINTNAVILEAIAYIDNGRNPITSFA